jgi:hypothetical protein
MFRSEAVYLKVILGGQTLAAVNNTLPLAAGCVSLVTLLRLYNHPIKTPLKSGYNICTLTINLLHRLFLHSHLRTIVSFLLPPIQIRPHLFAKRLDGSPSRHDYAIRPRCESRV